MNRCQEELDEVENLRDQLDTFRDQCHDGIKGACDKIAPTTARLRKAEAAYNKCIMTSKAGRRASKDEG